MDKCYLKDSKEEKKSYYSYKNGKVEKEKSSGGNSSSQDDNSNNISYSIGQEIIVANEQYYVIADSPSSQDYVIVLKANPLTVDKINTYGAGHVNMYNTDSSDATYHTAYDNNDTNHTGGMAYYSSADCGYGTDSNHTDSGCTNDYATSEVNNVIDAWVQAKFTNGELKTVDRYGTYKARLITITEYKSIPSTESWRNNGNYNYWTMSPFISGGSSMWIIDRSSGVSGVGSVREESVAVRPVINVYKRAIQS